MNIEEAILPDSVNPKNVVLGDDLDRGNSIPPGGEKYVAFDRERHEAFNPQNGRWYVSDFESPLVDYFRLTAKVGHELDCAYSDCDGKTTIMFEQEIPDKDCPSCGASRFGRGQFNTRGAKQRHDRISKRIDDLKNDFSKEMKRVTDAGVGPVSAMDYLMCSVGDVSLEEWANARGVSKYTVKGNLKNVVDEIDEEKITYNP